MTRSILGCLLLLSLAPATIVAGDWWQFRGNDTTNVVRNVALPSSWSAETGENIAWSAELPGRGLSGPIIVGDRVFVTASSGFRQEHLHVLCFDVASGERHWERTFKSTGMTASHSKTCNAAPTPASDGSRVFAFFSSNDLLCLDLEGNLLWARGITVDFPNVANSLGMASSPVTADGVLIVQAESDSQAVAQGIDVETGVPLWTMERPLKANWTSPVLLESPAGGGSLLAVLQSSAGLHAVAPATGEVVWEFTGGASTVSSSALSDGTIYAASKGITALDPAEAGSAPDVRWQEGRLSPSYVSPVAHDGRVYTVNSAGVLAAGDTESGKIAWQLRLKGPFSSTPLVVDDRLFLFNEEGTGQVVGLLGDEGVLLSENPLGETILATPAVAHDSLFIRSDGHLWRISETAPGK